MKISVIGYSGSGKSTLAGELAEHYGIKALHLDTVHWLPCWRERSRDEEVNIVTDFLDSTDNWVIDGNYSKVCFKRRLDESDEIIFMSFNRFASLFRILKRYKQFKGTARSSMTEGCEEKIDIEFIKWILIKGRSRKYRDMYNSVLNNYADKITVIKNQKQLDDYKHKKIAR